MGFICLNPLSFSGFVSSDPPSVLEGRDVGVTLGQQGVLQCEAEAEPLAKFEWFRDDKRYRASVSKILL